MGNCFSGSASKPKQAAAEKQQLGSSQQKQKLEVLSANSRSNRPTRKGQQLATGASAKLDPKQAAAKAAEDRLARKRNAEAGTLSQKLNRERNKSTLQQRRESAQLNLNQRQNQPLIYD